MGSRLSSAASSRLPSRSAASRRSARLRPSMRSSRPACSSAWFACCAHAWRVCSSHSFGTAARDFFAPPCSGDLGLCRLNHCSGAPLNPIVGALRKHQVRVRVVRRVWLRRLALVEGERIRQLPFLHIGELLGKSSWRGLAAPLGSARSGARTALHDTAAHWSARGRPPPPSRCAGRPAPTRACSHAPHARIPQGPAGRSDPRARCTRPLARADCPPSREPTLILR